MNDEAAVDRPKAFHTIILGGLAIGIFDFIDASTFFPLYYGITFQQVLVGTRVRHRWARGCESGRLGYCSAGNINALCRRIVYCHGLLLT